MIAKLKIFNSLSRDDDDYFELHKCHDLFTIERIVPDTDKDSNIRLMLTNKPLEVLRHNTYVTYSNNAVVHLKEGDSISFYPTPENFLSVDIKEKTSFTVKSITQEKVILEINNRKDQMHVSNGGTELGTLVLNDLEGDTAELIVNAAVGYGNITDSKEHISQTIFLMEIIKEESDNV